MKNKTITTTKDQYLLYALIAGMSILLILRDINGISVNKFIYFGFTVALMAVAQYPILVRMVCFILPLVCGLPGTYIMPCIFILLVIKRGGCKPIQMVFIFSILLMELFAAIWYPKFIVADIIHYVFFASTMVFLIYDDADIDYLKNIKVYLWGLLLLCAVIMTSTFADAPSNWVQLFARGQFRFGDIHSGEGLMQLSLNANSLAYYSLTGITCGVLLMEKSDGVKKVAYILCAIFFAIIGFLTVSRSWLLILGVCLLVYAFSKMRTPKHFLILLLVLAIIFVAGSLYFAKNPEILSGFMSRFDDATMESMGGRIAIFEKYMNIYISNPRFLLFGAGVTQYNAVAETAVSIHNGTQQILVCCGLVGFVFYMAVLITAVRKAKQGKKLAMVYWLPLISIVAFVQTIQFLNPMMLMLPFIIGIYALKAGASE